MRPVLHLFHMCFLYITDLPQNRLPSSRCSLSFTRRSCAHWNLQPSLLLLRLPFGVLRFHFRLRVVCRPFLFSYRGGSSSIWSSANPNRCYPFRQPACMYIFFFCFHILSFSFTFAFYLPYLWLCFVFVHRILVFLLVGIIFWTEFSTTAGLYVWLAGIAQFWVIWCVY